MALEMWECPCGRRVPGHVDTCRCGRPRAAAPVPREATPRAAAPPPPSAPASSIYQSTGLRAVGAFGVMILVYFGSRACNRDVLSRDVRQQAEEALTPSLGAENAKTALNRYHRACFSETYSTGWGRRQASKFDDEKYVSCVMERLVKDPEVAGARGETRPARRAAAPVRTPPPAAPAAPVVPAARPVETGQPYLTLLGVRPGANPDPAYGSYVIAFRVLGGPLPPLLFTNEQVICDGTPVWKQPGHHTVTDPSRADVSAFFRKPAGVQSCQFEVVLANEKMQGISNPMRVPLF